jgi:hypothetical protein
MNNWYYNEVEMKDKHKMLGDAGSKYRGVKHTPDGKGHSLPGRLVILFEQSLVSARNGLLDWYQQVTANEELPHISKAK